MGLGSTFLLLVTDAAVNSHEVGLLFTAPRRGCSHGIEDRHDVVPVDVLCGEREEDSRFYHYLRHCSDCRQYGDNSANYCTMRPKSLSCGLCPCLSFLKDDPIECMI